MITTDGLTLNDGQQRAFEDIMRVAARGHQHLLTGWAGTGKTTLMKAVAAALPACVVTAPTHKAVDVLRKKLREAALYIPAMTIQSLLGLVVKRRNGEDTLVRGGRSKADDYACVIIDEASMVGSDLMDFINEDLHHHFVLFVGDPAQLPPINERMSRCFEITSSSHLTEVVRQERGNPILAAASMIRQDTGRVVDWSWCRPAEAGDKGLYDAGESIYDWMQSAFTSDQFVNDNDAFRYIAYTNDRVDRVNKMIHEWIYGRMDEPFVPGERAVCRSRIGNGRDNDEVFSINQEVFVTKIQQSSLQFKFMFHQANNYWSRDIPEWEVNLDTWRLTLAADEDDAALGGSVTCQIPRNGAALKNINERLRAEGKANSARWSEFNAFNEALSDVKNIYAMTAHTSQGSTFDNVFVDIGNIRIHEIKNPEETRQLAYVAATRPRTTLILVGAPRFHN
jgi:exodeoxyribonuclease-5